MEQLRRHQSRALASLRRHAFAHSPFYRRFHAEVVDDPLSALPVLTKSALMEHCDEIVTEPAIRLRDPNDYLSTLADERLFRGKYFVAATAGTAGRRGVFVWSFREWVQVIASYNRAFDWAGSTAGLRHPVKAAVVSPTNLSHQSARVGASVHSRWLPTLRLDAGDPLPSSRRRDT